MRVPLSAAPAETFRLVLAQVPGSSGSRPRADPRRNQPDDSRPRRRHACGHRRGFEPYSVICAVLGGLLLAFLIAVFFADLT